MPNSLLIQRHRVGCFQKRSLRLLKLAPNIPVMYIKERFLVIKILPKIQGTLNFPLFLRYIFSSNAIALFCKPCHFY